MPDTPRDIASIGRDIDTVEAFQELLRRYMDTPFIAECFDLQAVELFHGLLCSEFMQAYRVQQAAKVSHSE